MTCSLASMRCGVERRWVPTWTTRPLAAGGVEDGLSFRDIDGDRLLKIKVGSGIHGRDSGEGVPVVGGVDEDDVGLFFVEQLLIVLESGWAFFGELSSGDEVGRSVEHLGIDIAETDDIDGRDLNETKEVDLAIPARADEGDALFEIAILAVGSSERTGGGEKRRSCRRDGGGIANKRATIHNEEL